MFKKISFFLVIILFLNITLGAFSKLAFATEVSGESVLDITDEENINVEEIKEENKKQQEVIDEEISKDNNVDALQEEYKEEIEENSEKVKMEENLEEINLEKEVSIAKEDRDQIRIEKGKNYEIKNVGQEEVNLNAFNYYDHSFDYAKYNQDGSVSNFDKDANGNIWLETNQRIIITNHENENMGFYVPYEKKNNIEIKEVKNPALENYSIEKGKNYEVKNVG